MRDPGAQRPSNNDQEIYTAAAKVPSGQGATNFHAPLAKVDVGDSHRDPRPEVRAGVSDEEPIDPFLDPDEGAERYRVAGCCRAVFGGRSELRGFAAPEVFAEVARRAEEAGWDGLLVWDHVVEHKHLRRDLADPWILVTAAALATRRIRLGTAITPVARRRPSKLAREVATLDRLTGGRMVLGVGLGAPVEDEDASFGDTTDTRVLAERLDEGLEALDRLWSGAPVTYRGNQLRIDDVVLLPTPVQRPRVPIWVGGCWPTKAPMRRAARWDGAIPVMAGIEAGRPPEVRQVRELVLFLGSCRAEYGLADTRFDIVIGGMSPAGPAAGRDLVGPLADLGITWWDERMPWGDDLERTEPILRRIDQGPPRI